MLAVAEHETTAATRREHPGRQAYIITDSLRYNRVARQIGKSQRISTRPHVLAGALELVRPLALSDEAFVSMLHNPFLSQVVDSAWAHVRVLVSAGVDTRGQSLTRLRFDVEHRLHEEITRLGEAADDGEAVVALISAAEREGYKPVPAMERVIEESRKKSSELARVVRENAELRAAVDEFGKKKARQAKREAEEKSRSK
jgi:hypothetical protein